jgi:ATP-dependent Clp protease, protease subunit
MSTRPAVNAPDDDPNPNEGPKPEGNGQPTFGPIASSLFRSRQVPIFGAIDHQMSVKVVSQLLALEQDNPEAPITVLLNSPGGSVTDGFAIYDAMKFVKPEIRIVCLGLAASIATVILLGAPKKWRSALPNTQLLIHQVYIPEVVYGQASDLEITARNLIQTKDRVNALLAAETGQTLARIERDTNRDYWLTAPEAVEYGLLSRVVSSRSEVE